MPVFTLNTNVKDVPADFKTRMTNVLAKSLGKPVSYIAIHVNSGQDIIFGGTDEPAALCDLVSIGKLSVDSNKIHSKVIMALIQETLKVAPTRTYISFKNANKADIGYSSTTFDDLM